MAKLDITITGVAFSVEYPDAMEGKLTIELARSYGYPDYVPNPEAAGDATKPPMIANPMDKLGFVVQKVVAELLERVKRQDREAAVRQATTTATKTVDDTYKALEDQITVKRS